MSKKETNRPSAAARQRRRPRSCFHRQPVLPQAVAEFSAIAVHATSASCMVAAITTIFAACDPRDQRQQAAKETAMRAHRVLDFHLFHDGGAVGGDENLLEVIDNELIHAIRAKRGASQVWNKRSQSVQPQQNEIQNCASRGAAHQTPQPRNGTNRQVLCRRAGS